MKILLICVSVLLGISALIILFTAFYSGKAVKRLFFNALAGIGAMLLINLTKKYTGVFIPINIYSLLGSAVFSVPAVIGLLLINLILFT